MTNNNFNTAGFDTFQQRGTTSSGSAVMTAFGAPVNNAILDPLQGYDADVWVLDQATGKQSLIGRFTSIQVTIRNATEPYLEFNNRTPRMLDGEFQMGWVLERGLLDTRILMHTFGTSAITRELRLSRSPRFQITFEMDAPELERVAAAEQNSIQNNTLGNGEFILAGAQMQDNARRARGRYLLTYCKVDSLTIGAMAGRSVIANRWEGLCEGIEYITTSNTSWAGLELPNTTSAATALQIAAPPNGALNAGRPPTIIR